LSAGVVAVDVKVYSNKKPLLKTEAALYAKILSFG
jgi:hypothetical protein